MGVLEALEKIAAILDGYGTQADLRPLMQREFTSSPHDTFPLWGDLTLLLEQRVRVEGVGVVSLTDFAIRSLQFNERGDIATEFTKRLDAVKALLKVWESKWRTLIRKNGALIAPFIERQHAQFPPGEIREITRTKGGKKEVLQICNTAYGICVGDYLGRLDKVSGPNYDAQTDLAEVEQLASDTASWIRHFVAVNREKNKPKTPGSRNAATVVYSKNKYRPNEWIKIIAKLEGTDQMSASKWRELITNGIYRKSPDSNKMNVRLDLSCLPENYSDETRYL